MIRAVIVDDEAPARRRLRGLLQEEPDVTVVAECANGEEAVDAIGETRPDLLFLDVRMPEMTGLEVLEAVGPDRVPAVVLVTALSDYALEAFELRAIDYLVKPFTRARFAEALTRVRRLVGGGGSREDPARGRVTAHLDDEAARLPVRLEGRLILLRQQDIVRIEGAGRSVRVHTVDDAHEQRSSLAETMERLDPERFIRVHNSHIVNIERIQELRSRGHGDYRLVLDDGSVVPVSRSYGASLRTRLGL